MLSTVLAKSVRIYGEIAMPVNMLGASLERFHLTPRLHESSCPPPPSSGVVSTTSLLPENPQGERGVIRRASQSRPENDQSEHVTSIIGKVVQPIYPNE